MAAYAPSNPFFQNNPIHLGPDRVDTLQHVNIN